MAPKLEGYKFGKTIGRGSIGIVKKCVHVATQETVAIKNLSLGGFINEEDLTQHMKRVRREIFLAKYLKHPNIMCCYEGKIAKKRAYIVMDWMEGGSLQDFVEQNGPLTEQQARKYFHQIIHGIEYCHNLLLVHRDIKPTNLLLDETKEHLKIADFGSCNYLMADLKLITLCGTKFYMAPEVWEAGRGGTSFSGMEVDIFSCGATLLYLLKGLEGPITTNFGKLPKPDALSATAFDLIRRMTAWEPKDRITINQIKNHKWFQDGDQMILDYPGAAVFDQGIDNDILLEIINVTQCDRSSLIRSLIKGKHTEVTTMYKLLKKKKMRAIQD